MKTYLYRSSNLKSTITFLSLVSKRKSISGARQKLRFLRFLIIISQHFFKRVFSKDTETNATSLTTLDTNFPEICAFSQEQAAKTRLQW